MYIKTSISEIERITQEVFSIKAPNAEQSLQMGITSWAHNAANLLGFYMKETENRVDSWYGLLGCRWECRGLRKLWAGCNGHSRCKVWTVGQRVLVHTQRGRSPPVLHTDSDQTTREGCLCAHRREVGNLSEGQRSPQQGVQVCNSCVATEALTQENKI